MYVSCFRSSRRRTDIGRAVASLLLIGAIALPVANGASAQSPTVFYRANGQANGAFVEVRRSGYILEPILQLNPLDTQVTMSSTGTRDSLASLLNPGPLGDFPSLIGLAVSGLPPIPYAGYPLTVRASHPLTPQAVLGLGDVPGGETSNAVAARPFTAEAAASEDTAEATGTGGSLSLGAGLIEIGAVETNTTADDNGTSVTITATSQLSGIDIAGLVQIESLEVASIATVDTTGTRIESTSTVGAIRALGAELSLDEDGFHVVTLLGLPAPPPVLLEPITDNLTAALDQLGLRVRLVQGETVEGPADGSTVVQGGAAGLEITLPIVIPPEIAIPSVPIPLGIPVGAGIPTDVTIALGRTAISAVSGSQAALAGAPAPSTPLAASPATSSSSGTSFGTGAGASGPGVSSSGVQVTPNLPSAPAATSAGSVSAAAATSFEAPDLTPAFRWTLLTAIVAIMAGWPLARRRIAGVPGLSATSVLQSLVDPRRSR